MSWLARKAQWQNTEFIYAEILNKTSLALIFTSNIFYIFFSFIIKLCCISFYFCPCPGQNIYLLKKTSRCLSESNGHLPRDIGRSSGGQAPLFVLDYRLVKTYFNRIFPDSSLLFFFLPCLVIFALNYVSVSWYF